jgi:S-adenosylmethionine:tRNA ribosyltransferase-isomerase
MKLSDFDYDLPRELIAQYPVKERDACRLLVVDRGKGTVEHRIFRDIAAYLGKGDLLVLNDTRVRTCRLRGKRRTGGKVEVFLLRQKQGLCFDVMLKPGRIRIGEQISFNDPGILGTLTGTDEVTFQADSAEAIYALGEIPLPPYIKRPPEESDLEYYQTVYAASDGSVASPTAGLHFTPELLARIGSQGTDIAYVTLHVGLGTFKAVTSDDITGHVMAEEYFTVPEETRESIDRVSRGKGRIISVGTTSCRTLESYARGQDHGFTDLFIYPGYRFNLVDALLTNFHLPRTTLYMLVCAFAGTALARKAYSEAISKGYMFYSYGDAMLIV